MKVGFVGLGKMGFNMATRLARDGHTVVATTRDPAKVAGVAREPNVIGAASVEELVRLLEPPRAVWVIVTAGEATETTIKRLAELLEPGDCIVDAGNTNFRDSIRHARELAERGLEFIDEGTSGGVWGLQNGYCLMLGGERRTFERLEPAFKSLAPPDTGYLLCGPAGSGHFVKMIHNGIEYGMMQAIGEGFEILEKSQFDLDLGEIAVLWNKASVVRSWLIELAALAFEKDPKLERIRGYVEDSGEGRWTVQQAIDLDVPAPVITLSLFERFHSRQEETFSAKVLAALRNEFGGHAVKPS